MERCENLKGDLDVNENFGFIELDDTDPEHPIIRFTGELSSIDFDGVSIAPLSSDSISGGVVCGIKGFLEDGTVDADNISALSFLARRYDELVAGGGYSLEYVSLSSLLSGASISVDGDSLSVRSDASGVYEIRGFKETDDKGVALSSLRDFGLLARKTENGKHTLEYLKLSAFDDYDTRYISRLSCTLTQPGVYTDYLASGLVGGIRIRFSSQNLDNYTAYFYSGIAARRNGKTEDYLFDDTNQNGIVRFKSLSSALSSISANAVADGASLSVTVNNELEIKGWLTANAVSAVTSSDWASYDFVARPTEGVDDSVRYVRLAYPQTSAEISGVTSSLYSVTNIRWNTSNYRIEALGERLNFKNGILTSVVNAGVISSIATTPWTGE